MERVSQPQLLRSLLLAVEIGETKKVGYTHADLHIAN